MYYSLDLYSLWAQPIVRHGFFSHIEVYVVCEYYYFLCPCPFYVVLSVIGRFVEKRTRRLGEAEPLLNTRKPSGDIFVW